MYARCMRMHDVRMHDVCTIARIYKQRVVTCLDCFIFTFGLLPETTSFIQSRSFREMDKDSTSLCEITSYFDFWREAKEECITENELLKVFATLAASYEEYPKIPEELFSQLLKTAFTNEGVKYQLTIEQERVVLNQLARSAVFNKLNEKNFVALFQYWTRKCVSPLKALIIVDVQNDFISGSLRLDCCPAKENAEEVVPAINKLIQDGSFDVLAYTYDWHPADHCSYLSNIKNHSESVHPSEKIEELKLFDVVSFTRPVELKQVMWPDHCVQNSWGAELHKDLRKPDVDKDIVVYKGQHSHVDSYSAFFDNGKCHQTDLFLKLLKRGVTDVYMVGLAFDVCVAYSAIDAAHLGFNTTVVDDACRGVDLKSKEEMKRKFADSGIGILLCSNIHD